MLCQSCIDSDKSERVHSTESIILAEIDMNKTVSRLSSTIKDRDEAVAAVREFARFVALKVRLRDFEGRWLSPPPLVDLVWREMVLDTRIYATFCLKTCGGNSLEYEPISEQGSVVKEELKARRYHRTLFYYRQEYGAPNEAIWPKGRFVGKSMQIFVKVCRNAAFTPRHCVALRLRLKCSKMKMLRS
jgi:hypothetical protein